MHVRRCLAVAASLVAGVVVAGPISDSAGASPAVGERHLLTGAQLVRLANVFAGTDTKLANQGTGGGAGNMSPAATAPFGMLSWGPRTSPDSVAFAAGYSYPDHTISGFDLTRFQGGGCAAFEDVPIMPTTTAVTSAPVKPFSFATDPELMASFNHRHESASPGKYDVTLNPGTNRAIGVAIGATTRAGAARFTFPAAGGTGTVVVNAGASANTDTASAVSVIPARDEVDVTLTSGRFCEQPASYTLHVVMRFDRSFTSHAVWQRQTFREGGNSASSNGLTGIGWEPGTPIPAPPNDLSPTAQAGAVLRFATAHRRVVGMHVGMSYVSLAGARAALDREVATRSVTAVQTATARAWARLLGRVRVAGGTLSNQRMLATTLYQSLLSPQLISDVDGRYPGLDGRVHRAHGWAAYSQMSLWDEYRTHGQLLAMIAPKAANGMARTLLADERDAGFMPRWPVVGASPDVMVGDPATPFLADLEAFGAEGFSRRAALRAAVQGAASNGVDDESPAALASIAATETQGGGYYVERPGNPTYLALHYLPSELDASTNLTGGEELLLSPDLVWGSASTSLEYATADFAISRLAAAICDRSTTKEFLARAGWWHNDFNLADGYVEPRSASGAFLPLSKTGPGHGFVEGDASQYTFMVPFDVAGLRDALGGSNAMIARLNTLFTNLNAGPDSPYAFLGNEPQLDTPYEYDWAGRPDLTQALVRRALDKMYAPTPSGYPGNTDGGTMTSWWLWNAIGLYPVIPGDDVLTIGGPLFAKVVISLPGHHELRIVDPSTSLSPFVTAVSFGGQQIDRSWLRFSSLRHGGRLEIDTGASSTTWAHAPQDAPPSYPAGALMGRCG